MREEARPKKKEKRKEGLLNCKMGHDGGGILFVFLFQDGVNFVFANYVRCVCIKVFFFSVIIIRTKVSKKWSFHPFLKLVFFCFVHFAITPPSSFLCLLDSLWSVKIEGLMNSFDGIFCHKKLNFFRNL